MKSDLTINQLIDDFVFDQDVKEQSRKCYRGNLNQFFRYLSLKMVDVRHPRKGDVINFKSHLLETGKSECTINFYMTTIKQFFGYLALQGIYKEDYKGGFINIAEGVHYPKRYTGHRKKYLKPEQVKELLSTMPRHTISDFRNFAIVNLMLRTGIRRVELYRMNVSDIYEKDGLYFMKLQRKGRNFKDQTLGITDKAVNPIYEYLSLRNSAKVEEPLFINHSHHNPNARLNENTISVMIKDSLKAIGINDPQITGHSLRHTFAITAIRAKISIENLQKTLGHRNSQTTDLYLTAIDEETRADNSIGHAVDNVF